MPIDEDVLTGLPLFRGLTTSEIEEVASHLHDATYKAGTEILKEGDPPGTPMFVLLSGSVEVIKQGIDGRGHVISTLSAPSVFGELEVLARRNAIATVAAATDVNLAVLSRGTFDELCNSNRPCALKLIRNLAQVLSYRLAATDDRLAAHFALSLHGMDQKLGDVRDILYAGWNLP